MPLAACTAPDRGGLDLAAPATSNTLVPQHREGSPAAGLLLARMARGPSWPASGTTPGLAL